MKVKVESLTELALQCIVVCSAVLLLTAAMPARQMHPDFSGRWVLQAPPKVTPDVPLEMRVRQSNVAPAAMEVTRQRENGEETERYPLGMIGARIVTATGESGNPSPARTQVSARWDGDRLVIERGTYSGTSSSKASLEHREVWSIDATDILLVMATERPAGGAPKTTAFTYVRRR